MYNFNHLYYFYQTAKLGGINNAAKYLRISQPSLSSQLKVLESMLDKKLLEKKGRGVALTNDGERVYAYCKKMFSAAQEMNDSFRLKSDPGIQKIRIGVSEQIERPFIADILSPLLKDDKIAARSSFVVTSGKTTDLIESLRARNIDLALTNKPTYGEDITELAAVSMPVALMVSSENLRSLRIKFSRSTPIREFIQNVPWGLILPSESQKLRQETDIFFQELKVRKNVVFEADILSVIARAILDGAGFGFLPVPYAREEIKLNLVSTFGPKQGYWKHMIYLIARKQDSYDSTIDEIRKAVKDVDKMS
jgi:LysR family transcriptional regulator, transcriptional activator of nhaA